jgi:hypothetical protein
MFDTFYHFDKTLKPSSYINLTIRLLQLKGGIAPYHLAYPSVCPLQLTLLLILRPFGLPQSPSMQSASMTRETKEGVSGLKLFCSNFGQTLLCYFILTQMPYSQT